MLSQTLRDQDRRAKVRISNAGFTITALPLLAAKDWGVFSANGVDVELIVMSPTLAAAADRAGRYRLCCRRRTGIRRRDPYRFAVPRNLVFVGQDIVLAAVSAAVQDDPGTQRQEDRHIGRRRRHEPRGTINRVGEVRRQSERIT